MSRMAKVPINIGSKISANFRDDILTVKGNNGEMTFKIPEGITLDVDKESIRINANLETKKGRALGGTVASIIKSMMHGVTEGFTTVLELAGVGYRAQIAGQKLTLALGYSHPVEYELPKIVKGQVEATTKIILKSCDKQVLGQTAAEIRKFRPPEPYKGKGILFEGEHIRRKAGKAAKASS